ncbi:AP-2 complex subunit sigma [Pyxicephalus adspersus]|uniref:AP-2 complex subunit sigma n=1 Tax=Pyxicephalus adspersus TaxID=30357 RepID=UPI003B5C70B1
MASIQLNNTKNQQQDPRDERSGRRGDPTNTTNQNLELYIPVEDTHTGDGSGDQGSGFLPLQFRNFKIIYRRYAGLYFCICVDVTDNNLAYLEAIHNFVEVLNEYFHNVCELDLVFNFYKVYTVVDEMFLAGEIRETSQTKVLKQLLMLQSLE